MKKSYDHPIGWLKAICRNFEVPELGRQQGKAQALVALTSHYSIGGYKQILNCSRGRDENSVLFLFELQPER